MELGIIDIIIRDTELEMTRSTADDRIIPIIYVSKDRGAYYFIGKKHQFCLPVNNQKLSG